MNERGLPEALALLDAQVTKPADWRQIADAVRAYRAARAEPAEHTYPGPEWHVRADNAPPPPAEPAAEPGHVARLRGWDDHGIAEVNSADLHATLADIDAAREALREAQLQIEYLHDKFQPTGSGSAALVKIRAALARMERGQ